MEATVSQIHEYPLRPEGFEEPLFVTPESRKEIAEHLARSPWLWRASELLPEAGTSPAGRSAAGRCAHYRTEAVEVCVEVCRGHRAFLGRGRGRGSRRAPVKRPVVRVLESWREIRGWWCEDGRDRVLYRVDLVGGGVMDLARDRLCGEWTLVGVVD